jgi:hypothetical protein
MKPTIAEITNAVAHPFNVRVDNIAGRAASVRASDAACIW